MPAVTYKGVAYTTPLLYGGQAPMEALTEHSVSPNYTNSKLVIRRMEGEHLCQHHPYGCVYSGHFFVLLSVDSGLPHSEVTWQLLSQNVIHHRIEEIAPHLDPPLVNDNVNSFVDAQAGYRLDVR
ncbi:hypothetical protein J6590_008616 [Homalodisca vitripennis]|nr:hypothetical protein J6590_008616 [Homalodisca vitripennis]